MRASPYDLSDLGYEPVRIETPEGKQEYAAAQREFAERGAPLRQRLIEECERLLGVPLGRRRGQAEADRLVAWSPSLTSKVTCPSSLASWASSKARMIGLLVPGSIVAGLGASTPLKVWSSSM